MYQSMILRNYIVYQYYCVQFNRVVPNKWSQRRPRSCALVSTTILYGTLSWAEIFAEFLQIRVLG
jgi:hypothetical protein